MTQNPNVAHVPVSTVQIERYEHGWRSGKPVEDPDKLKRWGFVAAKPSEYLVCTRRGAIDRRRSGQGVRLFKWPWETIAIVPTTLQRIEFTADQITRERIGVEVTGIAVYRIAEPELAFRVLNFTYGEAASEKLAATLREMFVGAARRLVANLSLDECLTKRKETIATYLMEEIAPVVGGEGTPTDTTSTGWGVVLDTIEIQQVQITSAQVFAHLQAPFRAEIAARAQLAELERASQVAERRAENDRAQQEATAANARRTVELERDRVLQQIRIAEEQRVAKAAADVAALAAEVAKAEATQRAAALEIEHARALKLAEQVSELELRQRQMAVDLEQRRGDMEARDAEAQLEAVQQRRLADIELMLVQGRALRELVTTALPQIARALKPEGGTLNYTQIGGSGDAASGPLNAVPAAIAQLIGLAQSFGLQMPGRPKE